MNLNELKRKRDLLLNKLLHYEDWIIGSIIETSRIQSGKKKPFNYLSRSLGGITKTTYVSKQNLAAFKKARESGMHIQKLLNKIIEFNILILKQKGRNK